VTLLARNPDLDLIRVAGRDACKVARLVDEFAERGPRVEAAPSMAEGVRSADIVCTATHSDRPVVRRAWLRPGTHVNVVGVNASIHAEIGELVSGIMTGRSDDRQITLYRSVGVAVQDAGAAGLVLRAAQRCGVGTFLALEDMTTVAQLHG
jgi:ornithine cyclodeaminase/alanine dehydrogenase-like protein (mu-crystallin family)